MRTDDELRQYLQFSPFTNIAGDAFNALGQLGLYLSEEELWDMIPGLTRQTYKQYIDSQNLTEDEKRRVLQMTDPERWQEFDQIVVEIQLRLETGLKDKNQAREVGELVEQFRKNIYEE